MAKKQKYILWFKDIRSEDVGRVGGKNSSLGEMYGRFAKVKSTPRTEMKFLVRGQKSKVKSEPMNIPNGFATTAEAYHYFLKNNGIDLKMKEIFKDFDVHNLRKLQEVGGKMRGLILNASLPADFEKEIFDAYRKLEKEYGKNVDVAVRSSATAEDLPTASFAGQQETYLNVRGKNELLSSVKKCIASLFTDRAISYREDNGFGHFKVALSVGVQKMVRSDLASSGVIFTLDTETGFPNVVLINSSWGLGEMVVQGKIVPDEFYVFKPTLRQGFSPIIVKTLGTKKRKMIYSPSSSKIRLRRASGSTYEIKTSSKDQKRFTLNDKEVLILSRWASAIEDYYSKKARTWRPMDLEWAKDGNTGKLFIVQARPETVHAAKKKRTYKEYTLKKESKPLVVGIAIGEKITAGKVRVIPSAKHIHQFRKGEVLVTTMTDPDWEPIMKIANAIVTDKGGRTSHAAIVSRELGIPAIVGSVEATKVLGTGEMVTVDCSSGGEGRVYKGKVSWQEKEHDLGKIPKTKTKVMVNIGSPDIAFKAGMLPHSGVGLAREEFIIAGKIGVHPLALYYFGDIKDKTIKKKIEDITFGYKDKKEYFIDTLARGVGQIGAAFWPHPVIVRFSDFKSNEYATLLGGKLFEPEEVNPMMGWRGASRFYDEKFKPAFGMECRAIKKVREEFGLKNIKVMIPFCRTVEEGKKVIDIMREFGLTRGEDGLEVYVMCEVPSNVLLAEEFLEIFDGMSIGSNDLTQLTLGLDRDSDIVSHVANENNPAVKKLIEQVIAVCRKRKKYVGICGQAPSDFPDFAEFLVTNGIESISLNPDTVIKTILRISKKERQK